MHIDSFTTRRGAGDNRTPCLLFTPNRLPLSQNPWTQRLQLYYDGLLSTLHFMFSMRRFTKAVLPAIPPPAE